MNADFDHLISVLIVLMGLVLVGVTFALFGPVFGWAHAGYWFGLLCGWNMHSLFGDDHGR